MFMKMQKVGNLMKINSHANLMAEDICSAVASFGVEKACNFFKLSLHFCKG